MPRAGASLQSRSSHQTEELGAQLARELKPGDVVLVEGELGSGKTTFVRGACRALGVTGAVTSPTFTIGQRYPTGSDLHVAHLDLYRIGSLRDEDPDLLADYFGADTITFVEWPDGEEDELAHLGRVVRRVRLSHAGADERLVEIVAR